MIWCLHGFLGSSRDWQRFAGPLRDATGQALRPIELLDRPITEETPAQWGETFVRAVEAIDPAPVLIGYSMGGRLALHAMLAAPRLFRAAVVISAGLGVEGEEERQMRRVRDDKWADRFEREPWNQVVGAWNAQPMLAAEPLPSERLETDFDRSAIATALRWWSPAVQQPLAPRLAEIATPILWIAGERDARSVEQSRRAVSLLPHAELWIVSGAGHRAPWQEPEAFARRVAAFIGEGEGTEKGKQRA
ncbi:MAG TPA: alpha/beta fold hydrolase [Thermoanaerobaculia bacterium]|nr:alpha/beta fold hydrolase [Thermoanaerobaculia bacterium]